MKCNRVNLDLTFSAALAGLLLSLAPSAAHGHGNNPKNTSDTAPDLGAGGGGGGPPPFDPSPPTAGRGVASVGSGAPAVGHRGGAGLRGAGVVPLRCGTVEGYRGGRRSGRGRPGAKERGR